MASSRVFLEVPLGWTKQQVEILFADYNCNLPRGADIHFLPLEGGLVGRGNWRDGAREAPPPAPVAGGFGEANWREGPGPDAAPRVAENWREGPRDAPDAAPGAAPRVAGGGGVYVPPGKRRDAGAPLDAGPPAARTRGVVVDLESHEAVVKAVDLMEGLVTEQAVLYAKVPNAQNAAGVFEAEGFGVRQVIPFKGLAGQNSARIFLVNPAHAQKAIDTLNGRVIELTGFVITVRVFTRQGREGGGGNDAEEEEEHLALMAAHDPQLLQDLAEEEAHQFRAIDDDGGYGLAPRPDDAPRPQHQQRRIDQPQRGGQIPQPNWYNPPSAETVEELRATLGTIRFRSHAIWQKYWRRVQLLSTTGHTEVFSVARFTKEGDHLRTNAPCIIHLDDLLPSLGKDALEKHVARADALLAQNDNSFDREIPRPEVCSDTTRIPHLDSEDGKVCCEMGENCLRLHLRSTRIELLRHVYDANDELVGEDGLVGKVFSQGAQVFFVANPQHAESASQVDVLRGVYQQAVKDQEESESDDEDGPDNEAPGAGGEEEEEEQGAPADVAEGGAVPLAAAGGEAPVFFDFSAFEDLAAVQKADEGIRGAPLIAIDPIGTKNVDDAFRIRVKPLRSDDPRFKDLHLLPTHSYKEIVVEVFVPEIWSRILGTADLDPLNPLVSDAELAAVRENGERWPRQLKKHCSLSAQRPRPCIITTTCFAYNGATGCIVGTSAHGSTISRGFAKLNWQLDYETADQILGCQQLTLGNSLQMSLKWAHLIAKFLDSSGQVTPAQVPNLYRTPNVLKKKPNLDSSTSPFVVTIQCAVNGEGPSRHIVSAFTELSNQAATTIFSAEPFPGGDPRIVVQGCSRLLDQVDVDNLQSICDANKAMLAAHANDTPQRTLERGGLDISRAVPPRQGLPAVDSVDMSLAQWRASPELGLTVDVSRPLRRFRGAYHQYLLLRKMEAASFPADFPLRGQVLPAARGEPDLRAFDQGVKTFIERWMSASYYRFVKVVVVAAPPPPATPPSSSPPSDWASYATASPQIPQGQFPATATVAGGGAAPGRTGPVTVRQVAGSGGHHPDIQVPFKNCAKKMNLAVGRLAWLIVRAPSLSAIAIQGTRLELEPCETLPTEWLSSQVVSTLTDWE